MKTHLPSIKEDASPNKDLSVERMKNTNSLIMTARGKKYLGSDSREETEGVCDSSMGDAFQFHHVRKAEEKKATLRKKKATGKSGCFDVRRRPGESTIVLESSPLNENALISGGTKMFHHKKLSVGNISVLESLKNLSTSFEMGLSSYRKGKSSGGGKLGISSSSRMFPK